MTSDSDPKDSDINDAPDPLDEEAAEIDARSPDAPEEIKELIEHAQELGRDTELPDSKSP